MKAISLLSLSTRWGWLRRTAVWLFGAVVLVIGLSACGGQADLTPTSVPLAATPLPATTPDAAPAAVDESPAAPAAAQVTTGFNISGWV